MNKDISVLIGKTLTEVEVNAGNDEIIFLTDDGSMYKMYHSQDCCESVRVEDVCGKLEWLVGSPIIKASEDTNKDETPEGINLPSADDSYLWTFYNIATAKGHVTIRWFGTSNGYYSESVDFEQVI